MARVFAVAILTALALCPSFAAQSTAQNDVGVLPVGADGRALNLDFETGTLKDWTATGDAFRDQPIKGDTVYPRRNDNRSEHQGNYWIGGFERYGDPPQGTLTSVPFVVTHPWASFLVGGGASPQTCVELVRRDDGQVFFRASGLDEENLRRVVVDLQSLRGQQIFIRLVDNHSGHWGHVNFDDFRFHAAKPNFPPRPAFQPPDVFKYAGLPPGKAAEVMTVPDGFRVKLFAGEPDVQQPIAFCIDDRGRLWVAEAYSYPQRQPEGKGKDRILIFEDTDGDGVFDKRTVFMEGLNLVSGLEVGFGGVWIGAAPYLMFVPVAQGDDRPAGPPKILLDGWGWQDTHETLNTFTWGPDGWLYGCHGVFTHSRVGKPGTPNEQRIPINAGIWRYHPTRHEFEVFAQGTSNPWGLDFNDLGHAFVEACVIPHNWHIIQGARYNRQAGNHFNPYTFADIPTIAEHRHYVGATPHGGNGKSDSVGGGHAHCGTMIYLGGTWPGDYRGKMFMGNIHGCRLNIDLLRPQGSGYVASAHPDFLLANDAWARFINLQSGPDGNVYLIDWYDKQACHTGNVQIWDRSNGRIYKIIHKDAKAVPAVDLAKYGDGALVGMMENANEWYVRHARRILQERWQAGTGHAKDPAIVQLLADKAQKHVDPIRRLRYLWALHAIGELNAAHANALLQNSDQHVRAWTLQLAGDQISSSARLHAQAAMMAKDDESPVVRLYLASLAQRMPLEKRWELLHPLVGHAEDAADHNLPLMYWYAAEPLAGVDAGRALDLALSAKTPNLGAFMTRRISSSAAADALALVAERLGATSDPAKQLALIRGLQEGLSGRRSVAMPAAWPKAYALASASTLADVRSGATSLAVLFGDAKALAGLRAVFASSQETLSARLQALKSLVTARDPEAVPLVHQAVVAGDAGLRGPALQALANFDHPQTPAIVLKVYPSLTTAEKRDALNTLASRAAYGKALLQAVADKKIAAQEVSADLVRQLRNLRDKALDAQIAEVWGIVRTTPADRLKQIASWKGFLNAPAKTDVMLGRAIYAKSCQQCHTLFGTGGKVGPDITGANRGSLDYLLENILDPSAVIPKEYTSTVIELKSGRVVTGIVKSESAAAYSVVTANETLTIPRPDVGTMTPSTTSMMPDDLLKQLTKDEVRALVAYLQSPGQTPMLVTKENAKDFFGGKDLSGWDGDSAVWSVAGGEIVGKASALKAPATLTSLFAASDFSLKFQAKTTSGAVRASVLVHAVTSPDSPWSGQAVALGGQQWGSLSSLPAATALGGQASGSTVKPGEWNEVEIASEASRVKVYVNGVLVADSADVMTPVRGIFGLQLHPAAGGELRIRNLQVTAP
jgi:putative membrane-bound dehydrogenase-like protein